MIDIFDWDLVTKATFFYGPLQMDLKVLNDLLELIHNSSVRT